MRAAVLERPGMITTSATVEKPQQKADEALISVSLSGVCGSDHSIFNGKYDNPYPIIPGHEAIGTIEAIGDQVSKFNTGDKVIIHPNYSCGECDMCRKGLKNICRNKVRVGIDINGVFADYIAVPEKALYHVPATLADEVAIFTEPLAVCAHGVDMTPLTQNDRVLVFGAGVIGQLTLQLARQHTEQVYACDLIDYRLDIARQLGACEGISTPQRLAELENSFDVVYETSGANIGLEQAVKLAAPNGTVILLGVSSQPSPVATNMIVRKELKIKGSMIYADEIPNCIDLLNRQVINTKPLLSSTIELNQLQDVLDNFNSPERLKTIVKN